MKTLSVSLFFIIGTSLGMARAQSTATDSINVVNTFKELLAVCRIIDFTDPLSIEQGVFYRAARYIVYQGEDKSRAWKDFANYKKEDERKGVNSMCERINGGVNRDPKYQVIQYLTQKESEGTWHVLIVTFSKKGVMKQMAFAFLKIGDRYGLGDID